MQATAIAEMMDTPREAAFDNIVFTAAQLFRVPMAMLAIIGSNRIWLKASVGPLERETPVEGSFCVATLNTQDLVVVEDATTDPRFSQLSIVQQSPNVRFFAGIALHGANNLLVAALCVLDHQPRTVPDRARQQLMQLAREAEDLLRRRMADRKPPL